MARTRPVELQKKYIAEHFKHFGVKTRAAKAAGVPYSTLMDWFREDPNFQTMIKEVESEWFDELKAEAVRRAKEKSDTLMIFLLKSHSPETYDDEIRRAKWLKDTGTESPDAASINVVLVRDEGPEGAESVGLDELQGH